MFSTTYTLAFVAFAVLFWMWYSGMFGRAFGIPNTEKALAQMNAEASKPEPRLPGDTRSELLIVGRYVEGGDLILYKRLVRYRVTDGVWLDAKTNQPINMPVTHWIKASEQDKLA